jgi:hypothetical protein
MTAITITPRNKKELSALKHFIKALDLPYNEAVINEVDSTTNKQANTKLTKSDFEKALKNSYTIDEFSQKTTSFLESLSWSK